MEVSGEHLKEVFRFGVALRKEDHGWHLTLKEGETELCSLEEVKGRVVGD